MSTYNQNVRRILVLTSSYPRFNRDSSSVFLRYLYRQLYRYGYDIHIITPDDPHTGTADHDGIHVHRFRYFPKSLQKLAYGSGIVHNLRNQPLRWIQVPFFAVSMFAMFFWLTLKLKPAVVHSHWLVPMGVISGLLKPFFSYKNIVTSHGSDIYSFNGVISSRLKLFALDRADTWTVNSNASAQYITGRHPGLSYKTIPMGVDLDLFSTGNGQYIRAEYEAENRFVILFVGRLVPQKGIQDLISAFSLLPADILSNSLLWIVGKGLLLKQLETQVKEAGLTSQVRFMGAIPHADLPGYYAAADLYVGPSRVDKGGDTESQGVVYLEAFASGTPVIATRVGGIPEVVEHLSTGFLVDPADPVALSHAIADLYKNKQRRAQFTDQAKNIVHDKYSWESIAQQFHEIYEADNSPGH